MVWPFNLKTEFTQLEEFAGKEFMHKKTNVASQEKNKPHNRDHNFGSLRPGNYLIQIQFLPPLFLAIVLAKMDLTLKEAV